MSTLIKNNKALVFLVVALLLSNIAMLLYFTVFNKHKDTRNSKGRFSVVEHVSKEVGFTETQKAEFKKLLEQNRDSMSRLGEDVKKAKTDYFQLTQTDTVSEAVIEAAASRLADNQKAVEKQMFRHFRNVRKICNDEQRIKYDSMVIRMVNQPPWNRRGNNGQKGEEEKK
jgi:periplasmic protein CpxP/Spy